jgi:hypothetical protein
MNSTTLNQGKMFKKYQKKITNPEKKVNDYKEGFETADETAKFTEIKTLQDKLDQLLEEYKTKHNGLIDRTQQYTQVTSSTNKYANKYIRFTTGNVYYVTTQGVAKCIGSMEAWDSFAGKNGCPPKEAIDIGLPWLPEYATTGNIIPSNPPLIIGSCMTANESCGNAGQNVFVNEMLRNSSDKFVGVYRDKPEARLIDNVPVLTVANSYFSQNWEQAFNQPGFSCVASSIYLQNNDANGPFRAFDKNNGSFWHSEVGPANNYNANTGVYEGTSGYQYTNLQTGAIETFSGEWVWIKLENPQTITSYDIVPRQDSYSYRSPNSWSIMGLNPGGGWELLAKELDVDFSSAGKRFNISSPGKYSLYIIGITKVGNANASSSGSRYCVQIAEWNLYSSSDSSFTNENRAMSLTNGGDYVNFDTCKQRAMDGGWKYFGIQDGKDNGTAQCAISNDIYRSQIYGEAKDTVIFPIWSSGTTGKAVAGVTLSMDGRLIITEVGTGAILWTSTNNPASCWWGGHVNPDSIQGSFGGNCVGRPVGIDCGRPGNTSYPADGLAGNMTGKLKELALSEAGKKTNFSLPSQIIYLLTGLPGDPAICCAKQVDYTYQCGGGPFKTQVTNFGGPMNFDCSAEVAECAKFILQLQDDGNMTLYDGNSNGVWSTGTQGKPPENNPNWVASKGKYGTNQLTTGQVLGPDEWIGSNTGLTKLIMQSDGNLVLYASKTQNNWTVKNDKTYGGPFANAVYEMSETGVPGNMGKLGFVDSNDVLSEYPDNMIQKTDKYTILQNTDSAGNDFGGMPLNNSNLEQCKTACTTNDSCAGFVFDRSTNNCWLKNSNVYPKSARQINNNLDLYLRQPKTNNNSSCSKNIAPIDSLTWERYNKSGRNMSMDTTCGLARVVQPSIETTDNLKEQIAQVSKEIVDKINDLGKSTAQLNSDMEHSRSTLVGSIDKYEKINEEYSTGAIKYAVNISGILSDTDQLVLENNYSYMFWSILAIGAIIITMNLKKRN